MTAGTDDAEENLAIGSMYLTGHLELCYHSWTSGGRDQIIGIRFPKFELPTDVIIDSVEPFAKISVLPKGNLFAANRGKPHSGNLYILLWCQSCGCYLDLLP